MGLHRKAREPIIKRLQIRRLLFLRRSVPSLSSSLIDTDAQSRSPRTREYSRMESRRAEGAGGREHCRLFFCFSFACGREETVGGEETTLTEKKEEKETPLSFFFTPAAAATSPRPCPASAPRASKPGAPRSSKQLASGGIFPLRPLWGSEPA